MSKVQGTTNSIENADATPPHLEVTLRLVRSDGVQGSLQVFAFWVAQLNFVNYTCTPGWNTDMLKACMSESSNENSVNSPDVR